MEVFIGYYIDFLWKQFEQFETTLELNKILTEPAEREKGLDIPPNSQRNSPKKFHK